MEKLMKDIVGLKSGYKTFSYTWRETVLYALGVGAKEYEREYLYGDGKRLKAVPTFSAVPYFGTFGVEPFTSIPHPIYTELGLKLDGGTHMAHEVRIFEPIRANGAVLTFQEVITNVFDRGNGKGIVIRTKLTACDEQGYQVFENVGDIFLPNYSLPEAPRLSRSEIVWPESEPDKTVQDKISAVQNYLYGLSGDINRIHIDFEAARNFGFEGPIMQGLCTFGFACRMAVAAFIPHQPERVTRFRVSFKAPVYPGTEIELQGWKLTEQKVCFRLIDLSSGKPALDYGVMEWI